MNVKKINVKKYSYNVYIKNERVILMGRREKYETHIKPRLDEIVQWCRDGLCMKDIAHNLGVNPSTLYKYQAEKTELFNTLKNNIAIANHRVENSLFKKAVGYKYTEVIKELKIDPDTKEAALVITKEVEKEVQPDVTAQKFWLINKDRDNWSDKVEKIVKTDEYSRQREQLHLLSDEELDARRIELEKKLRIR